MTDADPTATQPRRPGVLAAGLADVERPFEPGLAAHFREMVAYRPAYIVGYAPGWRFRTFNEAGIRFLLAPRSLPLALRIPVFALWLVVIALGLGITRRVSVFNAQSPYEGLIMWAVRGVINLTGARIALAVNIHGFLGDVAPMVHASLRYTRWLWIGPTEWVIPRADAVRVLSPQTGAYAKAKGARNIITSPTWSDWELFIAGSTELPPGPIDPYRLAFAGALTHVKGVDILIATLAALRSRGHNVVLTIAGDGPGRDEYQALATQAGVADAIEWAGLVDRRRVKEILDACYAFVFASRSEGLARVLIEAGACYRPVVATRVGGIVDAVEDGVTGILVPSEDVGALTDAVESMILDRELAARYGSAGHEIAVTRYSSAEWMAAYKELLETAEAQRAKR